MIAAMAPFPMLGMGYFAADPHMATFEAFRAAQFSMSSSHARAAGGSSAAALSAETAVLFGRGERGPRADRYLEVRTTSEVPRRPRVMMASLTGSGGAGGDVTGALGSDASIHQAVERSLKSARLFPTTPSTAALFLNTLRGSLIEEKEEEEEEEEDESPPRLPRTLAYQGETEAEFQERQRRCLATAIYFEARGEPVTGQKAVAQVVMNRVRSPDYPDTICGVVYQGQHRRTGCQFSFTCDGKPDVPRDMTRWAMAMDVAKRVTEGEVWLDKIGHATHYHATYVNPRWVRDMNRVQKIGQHIFYRIRNEKPYEVPELPSSEDQDRGLAFSGSG